MPGCNLIMTEMMGENDWNDGWEWLKWWVRMTEMMGVILNMEKF